MSEIDTPQPDAAGHDAELPVDELAQMKEALTRHAVPVLVGAGLALLILFAFTYYRRHAEKTRTEALSMLSSVRTVQDLENLVQTYGSSPAAPVALLQLAKTYFDAGNYDISVAKYDEFIRSYPKHELVAAAELGRVHGIEGRGQAADALQAFRRFAADHPGHFLTPQAIFGEARCLEQLGNLEQARTVYEDFIAENPSSPWLSRAEESLDMVRRNSDALARNPLQGAPSVQEGMFSGASAGVDQSFSMNMPAGIEEPAGEAPAAEPEPVVIPEPTAQE